MHELLDSDGVVVAPEVAAMHVFPNLAAVTMPSTARPIRDSPMWAVEVDFNETDRRTRADAFLTIGETEFHGWGISHRRPGDVDVPEVGEAIAASRALADLVRQLAHYAATAAVGGDDDARA